MRRVPVPAPVCAALLLWMGGFVGGRVLPLRRRSRALCGGCGGVPGGQSVQYAAAVPAVQDALERAYGVGAGAGLEEQIGGIASRLAAGYWEENKDSILF